MKSIFTTLMAFSFATLAIAQCDAPIVESWDASDPSNVTIEFTAPEGAQTYELIVSLDYGLISFALYYGVSFTGNVTGGNQTIVLNVDTLAYNSEILYFSAQLFVECSNGEVSGINHFYFSPFSLLNAPGYNSGSLHFKPLTALPDVTNIPIDTYVTVPAGDFLQEIDSIQVFIDLGHMWNGDLSIELISPLGTSVSLVSFNSSFLGASSGFSVFFQDGAPELVNNPLNNGFYEGPRGIHSPVEPLSMLAGENPAGVWVVRVTDYITLQEGMLFGVSLIINSTPCASALSGKAFYDFNMDNIQQTEEPGLPLPLIYNSINDHSFSGNVSGNFSDCSPSGSGSLSLQNPPMYYTVNNVDFTIDAGEILNDLDLALSPTPGIKDLSIDIFALGADRPGFDNDYLINYQNIGTECVQNIEIAVDLDDLYVITSSINPAASFSENSATLLIDELCPIESGSFVLTGFLNDTVSLGTELGAIAIISPIDGDENIADNSETYTSTVVGSFDPNDKQVNEQTITPTAVANGSDLKYLVRFQNTGTYYAERVMVIDTLDANLDPNSLQLLSHSHPVEVSHNGPIYYFEFDEIYLPDSVTNEPESHGYFRYSVQPYGNMPDGETIENTAHIFFDFNPAIVTNTAITTMDFASSVDELSFEAGVYPNPAKDGLTVTWPSDAGVYRIEIYDISGKKLSEKTALNQNRVEIDVTHLASGTYLLRFSAKVAVKPVIWMKM